jgi:hypothetical protein
VTYLSPQPFWRPGTTGLTDTAGGFGDMDAAQSTHLSEPPIAVKLRVLVQQAQAGDATALPQIRRILDDEPAIWRHVGDLSALVERAWIAVLAADNPLAAESMQRTAEEMKKDLTGENPTRMERMVVDQILACWMQLKYAETVSAEPGHGSLKQAHFRVNYLESAQKRYLRAIETLATVRKLLPVRLAPTGEIKLYKHKG